MNNARSGATWFLVPWATGFAVLTLVPLIASAFLSCTRSDPALAGRGFTWIGAAHYQTALGLDRAYEPNADDPSYWRLLGGKPNDPRFYTALWNSLFYSLLAVPLGLGASLSVALLLHHPVRGAPLFRAMVYLPHVLGGVATIVIWSWLLNPQFGWINRALRFMYALLDPVARLVTEQGTEGWPVPHWLYSPGACKPALVIMSAWTMGGSMLIFLAALRRVPPVLYEAARLDGAGPWHRFRFITIPQITAALLFNLTFGLVFAMQSFSEPFLLQNRQQDDGLLFVVLYLYEVAFEAPYQLGYASALGWILMAVLAALVGPLLWSAGKWVYYAGEA